MNDILWLKRPIHQSIVFGILLILLLPSTVLSQKTPLLNRSEIDFQATQTWVDSVYAQLTPDERIAQLFWVAIEVIDDEKRFNSSLKLIETLHPGGILFMKTKAEKLAKFNTAAKIISPVPLLVAIDGEWGLNMRINSIKALPKAMTMGAVQDLNMHYKYGLEVARQFKLAGIHVNLAPVADANSNPKNPIIGSRSYGENPLSVAKRSVAYMNGMQDGGIMAVAKHFPGHGDTDVDSHLALPLVSHQRARLDSIELTPFRALIKNGIMGVMTAHIEVPALDSTQSTPASLSHKIVTDLLKTEMGFSGLVITDAMNMKGVKGKNEAGRVDALALVAGNDVVESTENLSKAILEVNKAIVAGELTWADIEHKCRKVLTYKKLLQVDEVQNIEPIDLSNQINKGIDPDFLQSLYDQSIVHIGSDSVTSPKDSSALFIKMAKFDSSNLILTSDNKKVEVVRLSNTSLLPSIIQRHTPGRLIIGLEQNSESLSIWNHQSFQTYLKNIAPSTKIELVYIGSPYFVKQLAGLEMVSEALIAFESNSYTYQALKKTFNLEMHPTGKLPVTINDNWKEGCGK